jgi:hypothetical protein
MFAYSGHVVQASPSSWTERDRRGDLKARWPSDVHKCGGNLGEGIRTIVELNLHAVLTAIGGKHAEHPALIRGSRVMTYAELLERTTRLARFLEYEGLGCFAERSELAGHQVGQDLMAQCLYNGNE